MVDSRTESEKERNFEFALDQLSEKKLAAWHAEVFRRYNSGEISMEIDRLKAPQVVTAEDFPQRRLFQVWSWLMVLSVPAGLMVGYLFSWWVGIPLAFILSILLSQSRTRAAHRAVNSRIAASPKALFTLGQIAVVTAVDSETGESLFDKTAEELFQES
jgi:hypothetical protein